MMTGEILDFVDSLPAPAVYAFLVFSTMLENIFPPWPGDTIVVFTGFIAARGTVTITGLMIAGLTGNLLGAYLMYFAGEGLLAHGRRLQEKTNSAFIKKHLESLVSEDSMQKTSAWFEKWGALFVLVSRFSAGIRFFVSIIAGISGMNLLVFTATFSAGVLVWNSILIGGGYALGDNWEQILEWLRVYNIVVVAVISVLVILFFVWRFKIRAPR